MIKTLQDSLKLKDDQLNTIKDSLKLKDDQIKTYETSLKLKNEKIETLEKTIKLKEEELGASSSVDDSVVAEKDNKIGELQKEIDVLNDELSKADEEIEQLGNENEQLRNMGSDADSSDLKIFDATIVSITKEEIIEKMRAILQEGLHSVTITVPDITDLQDLYLYEVRSSVNMKISCEINPGIELHSDLLDEFESLDNISIRSFEGKDRYLLLKDGDELLFGVVGNEENNHLVFHTKDSAHIKLFNSLAMESWLRGRKI